jgi:hypothetical protein
MAGHGTNQPPQRGEGEIVAHGRCPPCSRFTGPGGFGPVSLLAGVTVLVTAAMLGGPGSAVAAGTPPAFSNFAAPARLGRDAGEPSIGANWSTGNVMMEAGLQTLRVNNFNDRGDLRGPPRPREDRARRLRVRPQRRLCGQQAVVVSTNNGTTWTVRKIPGTTTQDVSDPSIGIGSDGTVYVGYQNGNGHAGVAVSHDRGATWTNIQDVGASLGIQNVQFPAVVAGDDDKAAFAFLGTTTGGDDQSSSFTGVWHLYVSATYDGGATWSTVDATPTDSVQRGCIWLRRQQPGAATCWTSTTSRSTRPGASWSATPTGASGPASPAARTATWRSRRSRGSRAGPT